VNLTLLLDMAADAFGERVVVGPRAGGLTAARLRALAAGGAVAVRAAGADAVLYLAVNGPAFPVAMFAAAYAGVPLVPVNYRLGEDQLAAVLAQHPHAYAIVGDGQAVPGLDSRSTAEWLAVAAEHADGAEPLPAGDDAPAVVIYTSGTTSAPKGVLLRHENLVSYVLGTVEFAGAAAGEAALMSVPPYHIAAVSNVLTNLFSGRRVLVLEQFVAQEWLGLVRAEGVTHAMVVPTMLARILESDGDPAVPSLRSLAYGGAPMPARVIERALRTWPHVDFVNAYGLTETSSTITVLGPPEHRAALASDDPRVRARLRSAGRALPGVALEVRDGSGAPVPPGVSGLVWVRGEQVSGEYAGSGSAVDEHGYFCTRDQGHLDAEGYLYLEGRVDDTIIRGAENIAPAEIEEVLLRHPDVVDAVVVGVPDEEWGQRIEAAVVARPGSFPTSEELRGHARAALRGSRTPDRIVVWDELPRTVTGKLLRRDVLARLSGQLTDVG
jgi:acyl-CoA synthetase (AMP-forming)/AMP-acid ligase II